MTPSIRIIVLTLIPLVLTACGSSGGSSSSPESVVNQDKVALESPAHGATLLNKDFALAWSPSKSKGESQWGVTVYTDVEGTNQAVMTLTTRARSYRPLQLADNTTYTWTVEALDENGETVAKSDTWSFHTFPTRMLPFEGALDLHSYPNEFTAFDGAVYFSAYSPEHGRELWRKQGDTPAEQVADIHDGDGDSAPGELTVCGDCLYFSADDGTNGRALWVMRPDQPPRMAGPEAPVPDGDDDEADEGDEAVPGRDPAGLTAVGEVLYFSANGTVDGDITLWVQGDDVNAAVEVARDGGEGALQHPEIGVAYNGQLYVSAFAPDAGRELWRVEGESAGLLDVNMGEASGTPKGLTVYSGRLFFRATRAGQGSELWVVDGDTGPALFMEIAPGESSSAPGGFTVSDDLLFFAAFTREHGRELWRCDGTPEGTWRVKDILTDPGLGSQVAHLTGAGGVLYFTAKTADEGFELWKSDGTEAGTVLVRDILPGTSGSAIDEMVPFRDGVMFSADGGEAGTELWYSGGDANTTFRLKDIRLGEKGSYPHGLKAYDDTLWLRADDGIRGIELWQSDGTDEGTRLTDNINPYVDPDVDRAVRVGGYVVMVATSGEYGRELFTFNTNGGVEVLADIFPGYEGSHPEGLFVHGDRLFFSAEDKENGRSLWVSRGTLDATGLLKASDGEPVSCPRLFTVCHDTVYFLAVADNVWQLWETSGSITGTKAVTDENNQIVVVGPHVEGLDPDPGLALAAGGDRVYFRGGSDLWTRNIDGEIAQITGVQNPSDFFPVGGSLLFAAETPDESGPASLRLLPAGSNQADAPLECANRILTTPKDFHRTGDMIYFSAVPEGDTVRRLFRFTVSGSTSIVSFPTDAQGRGLSDPEALCGEGGVLWLSADSQGTRGVWQIAAGSLTAKSLSSVANGQVAGIPAYLRTVGDALYFLSDHPVNGDRCLYKAHGGAVSPVLDFNDRPLLKAKNPFVLSGFLFLTAMNPDVTSVEVFQGFWVTSP
ncbi:ELWxxDGT repeat protein [Desulfoluna spongiiphila]|uniref:ELWxxDGT repeat-containing protein n=1 Tax=Desulfoluna spongiiphila TaxID=419481 RepID=A0A1G5J039_9BACT|nr:ELWxxDGT repeat protein [Desulfoluna spongiiphila]SCY81672.1 ELWxxDGT repeat-containing protein [Desulfoluna spongiiphila]